jgi:hypothetical protein
MADLYSRQHHLLRNLPKEREARRTYALLSTHPETTRAVIFVHGFMGDAVETWVDFHGKIDQWTRDDWWEKSDLFFYSYPSVKQSTAVTADHLFRWVRRIFPNPNPLWFKLDTNDVPKELYEGEYDIHVRPEPIGYIELVLVGHSEGGLVLRRVIINAVKNRTMGQPLTDAKLRLFAPALFGAMPTGFFGLILQTNLLGKLARMFLHRGAAYQEMKQDSKILEAIRDDTEKFAEEHPKMLSLRALILWGEEEDIVQQGEYRCDISWDRLPNHDHVSICKPKNDFITPLEFVCQNEMTARSS